MDVIHGLSRCGLASQIEHVGNQRLHAKGHLVILDRRLDCVVTAESLGYDFCTCSEHVAVPVDVAEVRGGTYWDPLAVFGYLAARTIRIKLATFVLVLGYHHPLAIAKRYGTPDPVSGGRVILGGGHGWLEEEFELVGGALAGGGGQWVATGVGSGE